MIIHKYVVVTERLHASSCSDIPENALHCHNLHT